MRDMSKEAILYVEQNPEMIARMCRYADRVGLRPVDVMWRDEQLGLLLHHCKRNHGTEIIVDVGCYPLHQTIELLMRETGARIHVCR